jgi:hypothetical protein
MSLTITVRCDGHRCGEPCPSLSRASLGYSPDLRWDDPDRPLITPSLTEGWRVAALPTGGDLCPTPGHDEDQP